MHQTNARHKFKFFLLVMNWKNLKVNDRKFEGIAEAKKPNLGMNKFCAHYA